MRNLAGWFHVKMVCSVCTICVQYWTLKLASWLMWQPRYGDVDTWHWSVGVRNQGADWVSLSLSQCHMALCIRPMSFSFHCPGHFVLPQLYCLYDGFSAHKLTAAQQVQCALAVTAYLRWQAAQSGRAETSQLCGSLPLLTHMINTALVK